MRGRSGEGVLGVKRFRGSGEVKSNIHALAGIWKIFFSFENEKSFFRKIKYAIIKPISLIEYFRKINQE